MPLFVTDTIPEFCLSCGKRIHISGDKFNTQDWNAGASFVCDCGMRFQKVIRRAILEIAPDVRYYEEK